MTEQVVIIGAGPAGLTAAMQLRRYGLTPRVFEAGRAGGLLWNANLVENYPGFPKGIPGPQLAALFRAQAERWGVVIEPLEVLRLDHDGRRFLATTAAETIPAEYAVVASGTQPREFAPDLIPAECRPLVGYEVHPLAGLAGKTIVIVGAGDAAFDYALNLARGNEVILLNRGTQVRCLDLLRERAAAHPRVTYHTQARIVRVRAGGSCGLMVECELPDGPRTFPADFLLGALGREPRVGFVSDRVRDQAGALKAAGRLHFAGDVVNGLQRQAAIAAGDGLRAAMLIYSMIRESRS